MHYGLSGEADRWGNKSNFAAIVVVAPLIIYILLLLAPRIDPKGRIKGMGDKFHTIRFIFTAINAFIFLVMIFSSLSKEDYVQSYIFVIIGVMFVFFGNYFRNLKPNYFIGFRTPWALKNDVVWKLTHRFCSSIWFVGGIVITILNIPKLFKVVPLMNISIIGLMILIPVIYSYRQYHKLSND
jgi:uncharacterized membrane protein